MSTVPESSEATLAATHGVPRTAAPADIARGTVIGRYIVLGEVGRGAMGMVLAAYDADLDRRVAIKVAFEPLQGAPERRGRLLGEAQAMAKIGHTNVVAIHDVGTFEDRLYLAMEFVEGTSLRQWCAAPGRPRAQILDAFVAAARGLAAAHRAGVIHRDFKPDNVLVDDAAHGSASLRVRVADFGLASAATDATVTDPDRGGSVRPVGTPAYMAPEHHRGEDIDARGDQFAFCVALFEALWGQRPFVGASPAAVGAAVLAGRIDVPPTPPVPAPIRKVVLRGLAPRPDDRHASMEDLISALERARRGRWRLPVAAVALVAIVGAAWFGFDATQPRACVPGADRIAAARAQAGGGRQRIVPGTLADGFAEAAAKRLRTALEDYGAAWAEAYDRGCSVTPATDAALARARSECLEDRLGAWTGLVEFVDAHDVEAQRVDELLASLPQLGPCEEDSAKAWRREPTPSDPELATQVLSLRRRLHEASLARSSGRDRRAELRVILDEARATGFDHLIAACLHELAFQEDDMGAVAAAGEHLGEALAHAVMGGHEFLASGISASIVLHLVHNPARLDEAEQWARLCRAWLGRIGGDDGIEGDLEMNLGRVMIARDRSADALVHLERAERAYGRALGEDSEVRGNALYQKATVYHRLGHSAQARATLDAAAEILEAKIGRNHPTMISLLQADAVIANREGRPDHAIAVTADALRRAIAVYGPTARMVGLLAHNLAYLETARGRLGEARSHLALAQGSVVFVESGDGWGLEVLEAAILEAEGDFDAALAAIERASARVEGIRVTARESAGLASMRATLLSNLGRDDEALEVFEQLWSATDPQRRGVVAVTAAAAAVLAAAAAGDEARVALWLARMEGHKAAGPEDELAVVFARAVVRGRDPETRSAVTEARARLVDIRFAGAPMVRRMDRWLAGTWPAPKP